MSDRMAALLEDLASEVEFPETPALAGRVRARVEAGPAPVAQIRLPRTRPRLARPALVALGVIAAAAGLTLSLSATARRAVADLLGVAGIRITFDEKPRATPVRPERVDLGLRVSEGAAAERAGFVVKTPRGLGRGAFYFDPDVGDSGMVSVVYPADAATLADADLLVTQFAAALREELVKKLATSGTNVRYVRVRSSDGYWISDDPHYFFYEDRTGAGREERVRLAGNVLLWEEDGVTFRIEGPATLADARRLASSLR